ncbi:MAG: RnfABCDGE type electron transport complex subunit G [Gammaproteobacteria bacterium]|nr:RnfABCDGE type electron transport complex subunit G [Gammaproteobacteria bacterium]MCI0590848.1 RnfABCDGE type electron transport complex subunit G [Gammaproteobacteria bacterium]
MTQALLARMIRAAVPILIIAILGTTAVAFSYQLMQERIAQREQRAALRDVATVMPLHYDNDIYEDAVVVNATEYLGTDGPVTVYRARLAGKLVGVVLVPVTADGHNGPIPLIVGIAADGTLCGVRVLEQHETEGLGDGVDQKRSNWIQGFTGRSLQDPTSEGWRLKRDGGAFDGLSGATVSVRAIIEVVHTALQYYAANRDLLTKD